MTVRDLIMAAAGATPATPPGYAWTQRVALGSWVQYDVAISSDASLIFTNNSNGQPYISTDNGASWSVASTTAYGNKVCSSSDGMKLCIVDNGNNRPLYTSTNQGVSWTTRRSFYYPSGIACSSDGTKIYVIQDGNGYDQGAAFFKSTDSGATWTQVSVSSNPFSRLTCSSNGVKVAFIPNIGGQSTLSISTNSGGSFSGGSKSAYYNDIAFSADGTKLVAAHNNGISISTDDGWSWSNPITGIAFGAIAVSSNGSTFIAAEKTGSYIWLSVNGGTTWEKVSNVYRGNAGRLCCSSDGTKFVLGANSTIYTSP